MNSPELDELFTLLRDHGLVLHYPQHYQYDAGADIYTYVNDKHEWHTGADIRRMKELATTQKGELTL